MHAATSFCYKWDRTIFCNPYFRLNDSQPHFYSFKRITPSSTNSLYDSYGTSSITMTNCCASTNSSQNSRNLVIFIHYLHLDQSLENGLSNQASPGWHQLTSHLYGAYSRVHCDYRRVKLSFTRLTFKQTDRPSGALPTGMDPSLHKISLVRQSSTLGRTNTLNKKKL